MGDSVTNGAVSASFGRLSTDGWGERRAAETAFHGERAIVLRWDDLQATVLPDMGANLISFRDMRRNLKFLHEPGAHEMEAFRRTPYLYGIPILLPPNRYDGGLISFAGTRFRLPVNESATQTHIHGVLYDAAWRVEDFGINRAESFVVLSRTVHERDPLFQLWPFRFTIELRYGLSDLGLAQHVRIHNEGTDAMPCLLGFHTAVNAPFAENSTAQDYRCRVSIGERWELNARGLPTGRKLALTDNERALRMAGVNPFAEPMDNHYTAEFTAGHNRMELCDTRNELTLVYDVGPSYGQWMIWNNDATPGFFCAEPQVNVVNAPNLALPTNETGLIPVEPGEIWEASARMYVRDGCI